MVGIRGGGESSKQETRTLAWEGRGKRRRDGRKREVASFMLCGELMGVGEAGRMMRNYRMLYVRMGFNMRVIRKEMDEVSH